MRAVDSFPPPVAASRRWLRLGARAPRLAWQFLRWGVPPRALLFGPLSLGDDLLCTAVLREARARNTPFAMLTARPELFAHNPDPVRLLPIDDYYVAALRRCGSRIIQPYYVTADSEALARDRLPSQHIIAEMCRLAGLRGKIALRPYLCLTEAERARGVVHPRQIAIQSSGLAAAIPYAAKEWGAERFADVARRLRPEFKLVQIGAATDPSLPVDTDLRGKTSLREAAAVLAASVTFVGLEGFLAHLARSVDCPSIIVFGGRARPETFGYAGNINFYSEIECAPCGLREGCTFEMRCMTRIAPATVAEAVREIAGRRRIPLPVATAIVE